MTQKPGWNIFNGMGGFLKKGFEGAAKNAAKDPAGSGKKLNEAMDTIEKVAGDSIDGVESVIGKGRIRGAFVGVKYLGGAGLFLGIPGAIKGGLIGAGLGFILGQNAVEIDKRLRGVSNDNPKPEEAKTPEKTASAPEPPPPTAPPMPEPKDPAP